MKITSGESLKKIMTITASAVIILAGCLVGFFGVFVSVFADGPVKERLITIGGILLIYCVLSFALGLLLPKYSWKSGLVVGASGLLFLGSYTLREFNPYYLVYLVLIIAVTCFSAWGGNVVRNRRNK